MYIEVNQDDLYEVDKNPHTPPKQLTNFVPEIMTSYYPLADNQQFPQALDVRITWADHTQRRLILPMSRSLAASIRNAEPRAVLLKPTALAAVQMYLTVSTGRYRLWSGRCSRTMRLWFCLWPMPCLSRVAMF